MTRDEVKKTIASILDHPSIYMGGPSAGNLRRAERIVQYLEDEKLLKGVK